MKKIFFAFVAMSILLTSCQNDVLYSDYQKFDDILWQKTNTPEFSFKIKKEQRVQVNVLYRLIYGYPYMNMKSDVFFSNETQNEQVYHLDFLVRNDDKSYKGEIMGDFIDIKEVLFADTVLTSGDYKIKLEETLEEETLPFVMEVGIEVKSLEVEQ